MEPGDGQLAHEVDVGGAAVGAFSPDGRHFFADGSKSAQVLAVDSWKSGPALSQTIRELAGYSAYSPDGELVFTIGETIQFFNAETYTPIATLDPPAPLSSARLCFAADGSQLAVLGSDGALQLWDLKALRRSLAVYGLDWASAK